MKQTRIGEWFIGRRALALVLIIASGAFSRVAADDNFQGKRFLEGLTQYVVEFAANYKEGQPLYENPGYSKGIAYIRANREDAKTVLPGLLAAAQVKGTEDENTAATMAKVCVFLIQKALE